jgi:negative regulator of sigma-B (phosphoserine phosphatase)
MEAVTGPFVEWGVAGFPGKGQQQSGDRYLVYPVAQGVLLAVVDGLGHGAEAAAAAELAVQTLQGHAVEAVTPLLQRCHETTRGTRGVVIGLASIDSLRGTLTWLGVGNVEGVLVSRVDRRARQRMLLSRAGIVGAQLPSLAASVVPLTPGDLLILATDGIRSDANWQVILTDSPQKIADRILAEYSKGTDDALVLVSRYLGRGAQWR